jgi:tetratricopeptide (TPR) repeat protein
MAMGLLDQPGDLSSTPLAALLLELLNLRADGVLEVDHGGGTSRLWFRAGQPVGAQVATGFRPLGLLLLQAGKIDVDALSRSLAELATRRRPQGELLVEMGVISRQDVEAALSEQQAGYISSIAALDQGGFSFDATQPVPEWTRGIGISPLRTIIDALERPQASELVTSALRPVALGGVRLASGYAEVAQAFGWDRVERQLVARLEHPLSLEFFFSAEEEVGPERRRAMLSGLLLLGLAVPSAESPRATGDTLAGLTLAGVAAVEQLREQQGAGGSGAPPPADDTPPPRWTPPPFQPPATPGSPSPGSPAVPLKRSDPAEARARRQRLLAKAMQNMGVGPFNRSGEAMAATPPPGSMGRVPGPAVISPADAALRKALLEIAPRAEERSYFVRLGLAETAGKEDVKAAFLALARQFHPDLFAGPAMADMQDTVRGFFSAVNEAYQGLSDEKKRAQHLAALRSGGSTSPQRAEAARVDFQKGEACLRTRDSARARGFLESAVRADPRPEYQAALALTYLDLGAGKDLERARALMAAALAHPSMGGPGSDRVHYVAGLLAHEGGNQAEAERQFKAAVTANPRHTEALRELRAMEGWRTRARR